MKDFLFTKDEFLTSLTPEDLKRELLKGEFPSFTSYFADGVYKIEAKNSIGILIINGYKAIGIATHAEILREDDQTLVKLKSRFRPEYILTGFTFVFFFGDILFS